MKQIKITAIIYSEEWDIDNFVKELAEIYEEHDIPYFSEMNISIKERKDIKFDNSEQPHFLIIKIE